MSEARNNECRKNHKIWDHRRLKKKKEKEKKRVIQLYKDYTRLKRKGIKFSNKNIIRARAHKSTYAHVYIHVLVHIRTYGCIRELCRRRRLASLQVTLRTNYYCF